MKSLYESIKGILSEGPATNPEPQKTAAQKSQERGQAIKDFFKGNVEKKNAEDTAQKWRDATRNKPNTLPKIERDKWTTKTPAAVTYDNGVKSGNEKTPDSGIKPVKDTNLASQVGKPKTDRQTVQALGTKPPKQAQTAETKPAAEPTSNDTPKPAATDASSLAKAQGKETSDTSSDSNDSGRAARAMATPSKRASVLPADTMQKNLDQAKKNLDSMKGDNSSDDEDSGSAAKAMASVSKSKSEDEPKPQASETPAPKAKEDGNTKTDADGRTYVRQKGVMGQPDTWNRSYASAGDFLNKIKGKGDINGKETTKESYVNKTFGVSDSLASSIMEVMKKKESSAPRNDKEQDLAAQYGDPKRITHGDVLVARGVIKPKKLKESAARTIARNALSRMAEAKDSWVDDDEDEDSKPEAQKSSTSSTQSKQPKAPKRASILPADTMKKNAERAKKNLDNMMTDTNESKDTPGNSYEHQCAIHVKSESFGEGRTVTTQHADPDRDGYIAWYDVMFEHGIEKYVPTSELEILVSETHMHSKRKKTMSEDAATDKLDKLKKLGQGADKEDQAAAPATAPAGQAAMSYAPASSKQAEPAAAPAAAPAASGPKTNALGIAAQANVPGASALTGDKPAPAASGPSTNALGVQAQANVKGADALTGGASTPKPDTAQATATPKPAQSDAMSAIDGGSIGTSQMSYSKAPADAKQGIAANAPAARVVSTSDGAKEAGYTQPNQRIAGFKSNARAREQAAGAAGVEAPMPNGGGKTIAQVRQALTNKPQASGTQAPVQKPQTAPAQQASATPAPSRIAGSNAIAKGAPAGETPEDRARKIAAAKAKQGSYVQQGMVGSDF